MIRFQHRIEIQRKQKAALERISRTRELSDLESAELQRLHYAEVRRGYYRQQRKDVA